MKGTFTSVWDNGEEITTPAELDETTGEVTTDSVDVDDSFDVLDREFFTSTEFKNAGEEFEVCPECHQYITKVVMKEGVGKTLYEALVCSNPDCENN
jgi:uncharacterized protein with PIN domain